MTVWQNSRAAKEPALVINTTVSARKQEPTDGVGVPSPQPRQDRVMKTTPLAGYVVIVPSCLCWGEGTPTPSVGAPTVVKDKHLYNKPVAVKELLPVY